MSKWVTYILKRPFFFQIPNKIRPQIIQRIRSGSNKNIRIRFNQRSRRFNQRSSGKSEELWPGVIPLVVGTLLSSIGHWRCLVGRLRVEGWVEVRGGYRGFRLVWLVGTRPAVWRSAREKPSKLALWGEGQCGSQRTYDLCRKEYVSQCLTDFSETSRWQTRHQ